MSLGHSESGPKATGIQCNLCGCSDFLDVGSREEVKCRACNSLERTRVVKLFLDKFELVRPGLRVLHLAPELGLARYLRSIAGDETYDARALEPERHRDVGGVKEVDLVKDAQNLPRGTYDLIIHNHAISYLRGNATAVLYHLHTALAEDGTHLFTVPIYWGCYEESWFPLSEEERARRFGEGDHVRRFGRDDLQRSIGSIFAIPEEYDIRTLFDKETIDRANIPASALKGYSGASVFKLAKDDMLLR